MSAAPGFFQSEAVRTLLSRASRAAGVPLSVHYLKDGEEGPLIANHGGCAACAHVASISGGRAACRKSRAAISNRALRQARAVADVCHLGFGVLAVPALAGEGYVVAFGPFVPATGDAALEHDACEGLADLCGERHAAFPVPLDDIHRAPGGSVPAMAEWVCEELARLWQACPRPAELVEESEALPKVEGPPVRGLRGPIPDANALATAIAGGHRRRVRALVLAFLLEQRPLRQRGPSQAPGRLLALLTQTVAACAKAGLDTRAAMTLLPEAARALPALADDAALADCALRVLTPLISKHAAVGALAEYRALDRLLLARLPESLPLAEAAAALGKSPAAVSLHLQRRFGLNYSEYQGRLRIERAKELLRRTQLSATAIGIRVGIDDQSNFGKLFKRHTGLTPLQYRAQHAKKAQKRKTQA